MIRFQFLNNDRCEINVKIHQNDSNKIRIFQPLRVALNPVRIFKYNIQYIIYKRKVQIELYFVLENTTKKKLRS